MPGGINRRRFIAAGAAAAVTPWLSRGASSQAAWPSRQIRMIVSYPAGGQTDLLARGFGDFISRKVGQTVVVENKAGASGSIGAAEVARAEPDGHTILCSISTTYVMNRVMMKAPGYDMDKDLTLVSLVPGTGLPLVASPKCGATTLAEFVAFARKAGKVNFGTYSAGSAPHMTINELNRQYGLTIEPIHYRGEAPMWTGLAEGTLDVAMGSYTAAQSVLQSNRGVAFAVHSKKVGAIPDVKTLSEQGATSRFFTVSGFTGWTVPKATPQAIVDRLAQLCVAANDDPKVKEILATFVLEPALGFKDSNALYQRELPVWIESAQALGLATGLNLVEESSVNAAMPLAGMERHVSDLKFAARAVRLDAKCADAASIAPVVTGQVPLIRSTGDVVVEIHAAGVNPSDVKAATGLMPYAVFPRTPGRDFAGVVVDGPSEWLGKAVFGSSGDLGIRRDGTHATHLAIEPEALIEKPDSISMQEAAGIGVPFVTAIEGFRRAGFPAPGDTVLVMGLNGKVGQAATQLATAAGARVIGVVRKDETYQGHASGQVEVIVSSTTDVATRVREMTDGRGVQIVFNTVGDPYFQDAHKSLAVTGRQILIAAVDRIVQFNILEFYRGRHTYVGIDTLGFSSVATADVLRTALPGLASGDLKPFPIQPDAVYALADAKAAYIAVSGSSRDRIVLDPRR